MTNEQKRKRSLFWTLVVVFVVAPLLMCGGLATWWMGRSAVARKELDRRIAQLQSDGLPVDDASLATYYDQLADSENAAAWIELITYFESDAFTSRIQTFPIIGMGDDPPAPDVQWRDEEAVVALLNDLKPKIEQLQSLTATSRTVRFPRQFESFNTLLPHVQSMRQLSRLMMLEHVIALREGDAQRDFRAIQSMLGLSTIMRDDPILISQFLRLALHGVGVDALHETLRYGDLNARQLQSISDQLATFEDVYTPLRQAINGERALALSLIQNPGQHPDLLPNSGQVLRTLSSRPIDALFYLDQLDDYAKFRTTSLDAFFADTQQWEEDFQHQIQTESALEGFDHILTKLTFPAFTAFSFAHVRHAMLNRLAIVAVAIEQFKQRTGGFPSDLDAIESSSLRLDDLKPIGSDRFGYRLTERGAVLWAYDFDGAINDPEKLQVPINPPPTEGEVNAQNRIWVWRFDESKETSEN
ncbi:MAG: hypothetical protein R3C05_30925 [Pirellulaceae bacterium]